jgi:hypothetical protein
MRAARVRDARGQSGRSWAPSQASNGHSCFHRRHQRRSPLVEQKDVRLDDLLVLSPKLQDAKRNPGDLSGSLRE